MQIISVPSAGKIAIGLMQSMLDETEERRQREQQEKTGQAPDPMAEARAAADRASLRARDKISSALFSVNHVDINTLKAQLYQKLGQAVGVEQTPDMSSFTYGRAIEAAVADLTKKATDELSKTLGLDKLGVTLSTVIEAIQNPYSDSASAVEKALEQEYGGDGLSDRDTAKILQRLEDVAKPKTLAELKLGEKQADPTHVEDAETQAERQKDIAAREVSAKLDSVEAMHKKIAERTKASGTAESDDRINGASGTDMLAFFAAAVEAPDRDEKAVSRPELVANPHTESDPSLSKAEQSDQALLKVEKDRDQDTNGEETVLVSLDEIGLYRLLKPKHDQKQIPATT
ncbi:hypothetical protein [Rhizobium oryzicola]|uniref:DUF3102 domain-containing protein n=1 Tax=Rhizobium oryzicola TaxID=1232668 RepID=A0ABT8SPW2_9HYPH|nr:hypothetical protein [Rhizobium oryzicola]MDO1580544.1 hypothetical protein [Rhizobium oryzicola]